MKRYTLLLGASCLALAACNESTGPVPAPQHSELTPRIANYGKPVGGKPALSGLQYSMLSSGLAVTDLSGGITANDLAQSLVGAGVTISNVSFTGVPMAAGKFIGGTGIIGFEDGIILSSGGARFVVGPNSFPGITGANAMPGDADLSALSGFSTFDAVVLRFDFTADADKVYFEYVFASDEYTEFVHSPYNDVFAFYVNGVNCALVGDPAVPVSINTINNGRPAGTLPAENPDLYIDNDPHHGMPATLLNTEMDGLTKVLACQAAVVPNAVNTLQLKIADASDPILDSNVFIRAGSFSTTPPPSLTQTVGIDIKPGSNPNSIRLNGNGDARIAVAVLSSATFDAATVQPASVRLGTSIDGVAVATRNNGTLFVSMEDANGDGLLDMVLHFNRLDLIAGGFLTAATTELTLRGSTSGPMITGTDAVRVLP